MSIPKDLLPEKARKLVASCKTTRKKNHHTPERWDDDDYGAVFHRPSPRLTAFNPFVCERCCFSGGRCKCCNQNKRPNRKVVLAARTRTLGKSDYYLRLAATFPSNQRTLEQRRWRQRPQCFSNLQRFDYKGFSCSSEWEGCPFTVERGRMDGRGRKG